MTNNVIVGLDPTIYLKELSLWLSNQWFVRTCVLTLTLLDALKKLKIRLH